MRWLLLGLLLVSTNPALAEDAPQARYQALVREFDAAEKAAIEAMTRATTDQSRMEAALKRPDPRDFAPRFLALAEGHPGGPAALDALTWVASKCLYGPQATKALERISLDHSRSDRLRDFCGQCNRYGEPYQPFEEMLRAVLRDNPHRDVQGAASLVLADHLKMAKSTTERHRISVALEGVPPRPRESLENFDRVMQRGLDKVGEESAALYQKVIDQHRDLKLACNYPAEAAELARRELYVLRNLSIGTKAPEIVGKDVDGKPMKLSDYRGKVVVLDFGSHRSCGVCRQYYPQLRTMVDKYQDKPFALLGISVDDDVNELRTLAEKGETTWRTWRDGEELAGPIAAQWSIRATPTFYVLDKDGVIRITGFLQPDELMATVDLLLAEKKIANLADPVGTLLNTDGARP